MIKSLSTEEILALFASNQKSHYKKSGRFIGRAAIDGETILTIVNGKLETIKTASKNEIVLRNIGLGSSAETYIISADTFEKRYSTDYAQTFLIDGRTWFEAFAKGEVMAFKYFGETVAFMAPWGENMILDYGDWLANPVGGAETDVYRIEADTFAKTYLGF